MNNHLLCYLIYLYNAGYVATINDMMIWWSEDYNEG